MGEYDQNEQYVIDNAREQRPLLRGTMGAQGLVPESLRAILETGVADREIGAVYVVKDGQVELIGTHVGAKFNEDLDRLSIGRYAGIEARLARIREDEILPSLEQRAMGYTLDGAQKLAGKSYDIFGFTPLDAEGAPVATFAFASNSGSSRRKDAVIEAYRLMVEAASAPAELGRVYITDEPNWGGIVVTPIKTTSRRLLTLESDAVPEHAVDAAYLHHVADAPAAFDHVWRDVPLPEVEAQKGSYPMRIDPGQSGSTELNALSRTFVSDDQGWMKYHEGKYVSVAHDPNDETQPIPGVAKLGAKAFRGDDTLPAYRLGGIELREDDLEALFIPDGK